MAPDPYAALEEILRVIRRVWLSDEWRLEDVRLIAEDAVAARAGSEPIPSISPEPSACSLQHGTPCPFQNKDIA